MLIDKHKNRAVTYLYDLVSTSKIGSPFPLPIRLFPHVVVCRFPLLTHRRGTLPDTNKQSGIADFM